MVEVLDYVPEDLSAAERLLLLALAEKAVDATRQVIWARGDNPRAILTRRVGVSEKGLTKVLARLASRGLDPRVQLGTDRHGRPRYAFEGTGTSFQVPVLRRDLLGEPIPDERVPVGGPTDPSAESPRQGNLLETVGDPLQPERVPHGGGLVPPSLKSPSSDGSGSAAAAAAVAQLLAMSLEGVGDKQARAAVGAVIAERNPDNPAAYVSRFTSSDVLRWAEHPSAEREATPSARPRRRRCERGFLLGTDGHCCDECDRDARRAG